MAEVVVQAQRHYRYHPTVMWKIFADPELSSTLDDRVSLVSSDGAPGTVGSSYDLSLKLGPLSLTQRVTVRDSTEHQRLEAVTEMEGKVAAIQVAELVEAHGGTDLTWTITMNASRPMVPIARKKASKELAVWLDAAEAAARRLL